MHKLSFLLAGCLLLAGCSTTLVRDEPKAIRIGAAGVCCAVAPLAEALLERRGVTVHAIQGTWRDHVFAAECVTKGEPGSFTAIFLAPQMRLATLTVTPPHKLTFDRAHQIPTAFEPEYALFDLSVVNLPSDVLRRALGADFTVVETATKRTVSSAGVTLAVRTLLADGTVHYENLALGYAYTLKEVK